MAAVLLKQYLSDAAALRFQWGTHDCMLFAADWAQRLTGIDPAAQWRGSYASADAAEALIERHGGARGIVAAGLRAAGWRPVWPPKAGDICVVEAPAPGGTAHVAGVAVDIARVALATARGLVIAPAPIVEAWRHG